MERLLRPGFLAFALLAAAGSVVAVVPAWLKAAAAAPATIAVDNAPAVVLVDDSVLEVDATGIMVETHRYAVRILHNAGRQHARAEVVYNGASSKVESLGAWVVRGGKEFAAKPVGEWVDVSAESAGAVVDEQRVLLMRRATLVRWPIRAAPPHAAREDKRSSSRWVVRWENEQGHGSKECGCLTWPEPRSGDLY